jgi:hypothetical protein
VVIVEFNVHTFTNTVMLASCSTTLVCAAPVLVSGSNTEAGSADVQVRSDGLITVSFSNANADGSADILFTTCAPAAAPSAPVCGSPTTVTHVAHPLLPSITVSVPMVNITLPVFTFPKHANRTNTGGSFTTFLTYEDCKGFLKGASCLDAEVVMATSADNGSTWTAPVSVDTASGHHFFEAISTDTSTGIVNLSYMSASADKYNHEVEVMRNQIAAGATTLGTPLQVTTILDPIDSNPQKLGLLQSDLYMGIKARGTGTVGQSRLYTSFDSTFVPGTYNGVPDNELNNTIDKSMY